jgi:nicotinamide phosphoribosyltransferase
VVRDGERLVAKRRDSVTAGDDLLVPVWPDGTLLVRHSFDEVRARAAA